MNYDGNRLFLQRGYEGMSWKVLFYFQFFFFITLLTTLPLDDVMLA
jgi:hypothetical protein